MQFLQAPDLNVHLKIHGPVSIEGCTTQERLYEENANRCFLLYLDESAG